MAQDPVQLLLSLERVPRPVPFTATSAFPDPPAFPATGLAAAQMPIPASGPPCLPPALCWEPWRGGTSGEVSGLAPCHQGPHPAWHIEAVKLYFLRSQSTVEGVSGVVGGEAKEGDSSQAGEERSRPQPGVALLWAETLCRPLGRPCHLSQSSKMTGRQSQLLERRPVWRGLGVSADLADKPPAPQVSHGGLVSIRYCTVISSDTSDAQGPLSLCPPHLSRHPLSDL